MKQLRRFLKERLQRDFTTFRGNEIERENLTQLLQRTVDMSESNSILLIGPRGSGKTTLINAVITDLLSKTFLNNTFIVYLNGNVHTDDRLALKAATVQMELENATDGKVFGSFAENLSFLLACLKSGDKKSKSVIFILEEFDLFCAHHNQTLLYNLFDISQSAQAPICVLGITCRLDVIELLEKRVKSRFSHRQIFLFPNAEDFKGYTQLCENLLSIPSDNEIKEFTARVAKLKLLKDTKALAFQINHYDPSKFKFTKKFQEAWNKEISKLFKNTKVIDSLQRLFDFDTSQAFLKTFLYRLVSQLQVDSKEPITFTTDEFIQLIANYDIDDKVDLICGLSVLELCLVISIKHHSEIYDRDPFNFEIIHSRFNKFSKISTTMQGIERSITLKAFEHLRNIELILPLSSAPCKIQKEFEMHRVALTYSQINQAIQKYQALPTEVSQWAQSSVV